jgi:hypothetical protein
MGQVQIVPKALSGAAAMIELVTEESTAGQFR